LDHDLDPHHSILVEADPFLLENKREITMG
jgi:hypothetical protein